MYLYSLCVDENFILMVEYSYKFGNIKVIVENWERNKWEPGSSDKIKQILCEYREYLQPSMNASRMIAKLQRHEGEFEAMKFHWDDVAGGYSPSILRS